MSPVMHPDPATRGGICVAVAMHDTKGVVEAVKPLEKDIDVVEIRLDAMGEADIPQICRAIERPLLFTNRPTWEGGLCSEPEDERLRPLLEAARQKAAYVDLELKTESHYRQKLLTQIHGNRTRLIISHHDFEKTPDAETLSAILRQQAESGAQIGKIVTMAHSHVDVLRVLHLQCEARERNFPLIAFCMGEAGKLSRIITLLLGGFMTYAAIDEQQATAPGQLSVHRLKEAMAVLSGKRAAG